jgi:4-hydroxybenzoate polyprenyltransferase
LDVAAAVTYVSPAGRPTGPTPEDKAQMNDTPAAMRDRPGLSDYLAIARFDHMTKHVFVLPGMALALLLRGVHSPNVGRDIALGFIAVIAIASANYVINEYLDREFDRHHPTKSARTAVQLRLDPRLVALQWAAFAAIGLAAAALSSPAMLATALVFAGQGIVYNVRPLRSKDIAWLDVISEAINNPLRMIIGWLMIDPTTLPPASILICYWTGGAFLMAAKRLSEYRDIVASHGCDLLARYRKSFASYTETSLTVSCFLYAILSAFFLAVFLIKYRIEFIITLPAFAGLFALYLALAMQAGSVAQKPEKLFRQKSLMLAVAIVTLTVVVATFVDMPFLRQLTARNYISLTP